MTKEIDDISVKAAKAVGGDFVGVDLMESAGMASSVTRSTTRRSSRTAYPRRA